MSLTVVNMTLRPLNHALQNRIEVVGTIGKHLDQGERTDIV
jgi:hypothetical protein